MSKEPKKPACRQARQRYYTLMIIPHDASGRTINVKIPASLVYATLGVAVFSLLVVGSSVVYSSLLSRRLAHYYTAIAKNREQQREIALFTQQTEKVNQQILELTNEDNKLRELLGLKSWKGKAVLSSDIKDIKDVDLKLVERKKSLEELKSWVNMVRARFANTPSRWPLYGPVMSRFGYRIFPWQGFHSGMDVSTQYGSPVRVTADGAVSYVGWMKGYGRTVVVNHGYGLSTLYAHLSRYPVVVGQKVRKGQVICYVGTTGYTTGPHLHYEVQKNGRAVNPAAYLDLNILSASRIWRP